MNDRVWNKKKQNQVADALTEAHKVLVGRANILRYEMERLQGGSSWDVRNDELKSIKAAIRKIDRAL